MVFQCLEYGLSIEMLLLLTNMLQHLLRVLNCEDHTTCNDISSSNTNTETIVVVKPKEQSISEITPETVRPYPKTKLNLKIARKGGRRKGKVTILTDTPQKNEIALRTFDKNKNIKRKLFYADANMKKQKNKNPEKQW